MVCRPIARGRGFGPREVFPQRVQLFRDAWPRAENTQGILAEMTNVVRRRCRTEWCLSIQANEVLHEASARRLAELPVTHPGVEIFTLPYLVLMGPRLVWTYNWRRRLFRNIPDIVAVGDAFDVQRVLPRRCPTEKPTEKVQLPEPFYRLSRVEMSRRELVRRLVVGTAFAVPIVTSFDMSSLTTSSADALTPNQSPGDIASLVPNHGPQAGGNTVTITFASTIVGTVTSVHFGAAAAHVTGVTSTSVTVLAPAGAGTVAVTVTTQSGGTTLTNNPNDVYTYDKIATTLAAKTLIVTGFKPTVTLTRNDTGGPLAGRLISFFVSGKLFETATTNSKGVASGQKSVFNAGGFTATFAGDATYVTSSAKEASSESR